ncbi:hypothetical protein [Streptomyces griseoloalbus]|uniref:Head-to-tail stopper n=1 Tax=Streptomyces griseoloalbus TaxID=67303 RepID=A0A7W8BVU3_9ACTN|nr:hypothetical protein [Streptomyces albaduncus]MBB5129822.1 hypothetical protein [Streptomyces albaduncus]GGW80904.1 hypothetical protein GCM10010340_68800 [Streptomyces albaduncus]
MPAPYPFGETVRILRTGPSPGRDPRGQPLPGPDESFDVLGCVVTPREQAPTAGGSEQQGRDTVIVGWTVYAPAGTVIRTTDKARIRGVVCEITGESGDWGRNPFTGIRGPVQFAADRVTG